MRQFIGSMVALAVIGFNTGIVQAAEVVVVEFKCPEGTKFSIPKGQEKNVAIDITFPGEKSNRFGVGDYATYYKVEKGVLKLVMDDKKKPDSYGFGATKEITAKIGDEDAKDGKLFPLDYEGKPLKVELKAAK